VFDNDVKYFDSLANGLFIKRQSKTPLDSSHMMSLNNTGVDTDKDTEIEKDTDTHKDTEISHLLIAFI